MSANEHGETMQVSDANYASAVGSDAYHINRLKIALDLLKKHVDLRRRKVFDFGCGEGTFMRILEREGAEVSGVDPSQVLVDLAPKNAAVGSVEVLEQIPTGAIDVLVVLNVLAYVPLDLQARFWPAARAAVRPGGFMLQANANSQIAKGREYTFMANPKTFPQVLKSHGFTEIGRDFHRFRPDPLSRKFIGREIVDQRIQALIPLAIRARRSTGYFSVSRADQR